MTSKRDRDLHEHHKKIRNRRFSLGIYGDVKRPTVSRDRIGVWDPPSYCQSRLTASHTSTTLNDGVNRRLDLRCFYTGVVCDPPPARPTPGWKHDPIGMPWLGTRDHLIPARRHLDQCRTINPGHHESTKVWASNVVNATLGLAPLPVRIRIRQWLMTTAIDREDRSMAAGENMKWLIISMLDEFRLNGRYPWSRKPDGSWWYPDISKPFMERMLHLEQEFLALGGKDRDAWISGLTWRF